jgi:hypothetical protein
MNAEAVFHNLLTSPLFWILFLIPLVSVFLPLLHHRPVFGWALWLTAAAYVALAWYSGRVSTTSTTPIIFHWVARGGMLSLGLTIATWYYRLTLAKVFPSSALRWAALVAVVGVSQLTVFLGIIE